MAGSEERLEKELLALIAELARELHPGRPVPELRSDSHLERDAGLDSLGRVELILRMERRFGARLPDEVAVRAETPAELLEPLREAGGRPDPEPASNKPAKPRGESTQAAAEPKSASTLPEALDWHAERAGDRTCVTLFDDGGDGPGLTYAELREGAAEVAAGLRERGLGPGETVALMLPTGLDFFFAFHGVQWAGGIPVPLYPPVRASQVEDHFRRVATVLENAGCRHFIASRETVRAGQLLKSLVPRLETVVTVPDLRRGVGPAERVPRRGDDIAFLQYTSGTTGQPKGVTLTHANLLANIRAIGEVVEAGPEDRFVSWLPLYHDMGLIGACLGTLYYSVPLTLMSPLQFMARPQRWLWAIHRDRGTLSAAPNFAYDLCANRLQDEELEGLDLSSWRTAFNGAEPVSPGTLKAFQERFSPYGFAEQSMKPVYGLAESSVGLSFPPLDRPPKLDRIRRDRFEREGQAELAPEDDPDPRLFVACGQALPGHEMRVVDEQNRPLPDRQQGQLQFRGPSCTQGYFNNPEATEKLFEEDGWLNSGDLAYLDAGELYLTGRVKDMIIRGGRNYYPYELEQAVSSVPGVRANNVAVFASADPDGGSERLVIVAETREQGEGERDEIREAITEASLKLLQSPPEVIELVPPESIPKTSSGKIRRPACRDLFERGELGQSAGMTGQLLRLMRRGVLPLLSRASRGFGHGLFAAWVWLQGLVIGLPALVLILLLPGRTAPALVARGACRLILGLAGLGPELKPSGEKGRRSSASLPEGPCVVIANHASYLDGPVLRAALSGRLRFVAKRELRRNPLLGPLLARVGADWVERFDHRRGLEDLERAMAHLEGDERLCFFPEGTFVVAPGLREFRIGAFMAAVRKQVPVVPVAIRGSREVLGGFRFFPRPGRISLQIGDPIEPSGDDWDAALALRDQARAWILEHCGEPDVASGDMTLLGRGEGGRL